MHLQVEAKGEVQVEAKGGVLVQVEAKGGRLWLKLKRKGGGVFQV